MKSNTCFKKDGQPLTEYWSEYEAQEGADYINNTYNKNLSSYACKKCGKFHLSPKDRQTPSTICPSCVDGNGTPKDLYSNEESARRRAAILHEEWKLELNIYECPDHDGWHLTKQSV